MKERENAKNEPPPALNAPNGSRDTPIQSQEFEEDGRRHLWIFSLVFA